MTHFAGRLISILGFCIVVDCASAFGACYNVATGEPQKLSGRLIERIFAGPPNYEDVQQGDTPELTFILQLNNAICISGDDFADPSLMFPEVHLVPTDQTRQAMRALLNSSVRVFLTQNMAAETGHHHRPLVAWVSQIVAVQSSINSDATAEYGTGATTVRGFYYALGMGNGEEAVRFVIPEKRGAGAFNPAQISAFYRGLSEPLKLLDVQPNSPTSYTTSYIFRAKDRDCNGKSIVTVVNRDGRFYISGIKALSGC